MNKSEHTRELPYEDAKREREKDRQREGEGPQQIQNKYIFS